MFQERFIQLICLSNMLLFKRVQRQLSNYCIQTHTSFNLSYHYAMGTDHGSFPFSVSFTLGGSPCLLANPYEPHLPFYHRYIASALILFHDSHRNNENSADCEENVVLFVKRQSPQRVINYTYVHSVIVAATPERNKYPI